jgi:hypothetical protein
MAASAVCRMIWFMLYENHNDLLFMVLLNRVSMLLQCTGVTMMLFLWVQGMVTNKAHFLTAKKIIIVMLTTVWIFIFASAIHPQDDWYLANLILISAVSFFISFSSLCYGLAVSYKIRTTLNDETLLSSDYSKRKGFARRLILVCAAVSGILAVRAYCFASVRFYKMKGLYPWFFYQVR